MRTLLMFLCLISTIPVDVKAAELLVRRKQNANSAAMSYRSSPEDAKVQKIHFSSEEEKKAFKQNLDANEYEWEENQIYRGTDYAINAEAEAAVAAELKADPLFGTQWSLFSSTSDPARFSGVDIDAVRAWSVTKGSANVIVYVMDSGIVRAPDPDFEDRIVSYYDGTNPGAFPDDQNSHGTHVASIIGAKGDNNYGIKGVVPGTIQIGVGRFLNSSNQGSTDTALKVLDWILNDYNERKKTNSSLHCVVNNSWDGGFSAFLEDELEKLAKAGCLLITSAGNNGRNNDQTPDYPCNYEKIKSRSLCVGATDSRDKRAVFSSYGPKSVDLYAPGVNIVGNIPGTTTAGKYSGRTEQKSGTSQAVPHVAGAAALVWAANEKLTPSEVRNIIISSVDRLPGQDAEVYSGGRLNAYRAVLVATGQDPSLADRGLSSEASDGGGCSLVLSSQTTAPRDVLWTLLVVLALGGIFSANVRSRADKALRVRAHRRNDGDANNR